MFENIFNYRMVIIGKNDKYNEYPKINYYKKYDEKTLKSMEHEDWIRFYAREKGYSFYKDEYIAPEMLARLGNIIFYNCDNKSLIIYLPEEVTDEQLFQLEYMEDVIKGVKYINAAKFDKNCNAVEEYLFDNLHNDDIYGDTSKRYSHEIVQSYYDAKIKKR